MREVCYTAHPLALRIIRGITLVFSQVVNLKRLQNFITSLQVEDQSAGAKWFLNRSRELLALSLSSSTSNKQALSCYCCARIVNQFQQQDHAAWRT